MLLWGFLTRSLNPLGIVSFQKMNMENEASGTAQSIYQGHPAWLIARGEDVHRDEEVGHLRALTRGSGIAPETDCGYRRAEEDLVPSSVLNVYYEIEYGLLKW